MPPTSPSSLPAAPRRRRAGAVWLLWTSLVARFGDLTVALPVILLVVDATDSYAWAGLTSGALAVGAAVATPALGRLADDRGHRVVLGTAAGLSATFLVALALGAAHLPAPAVVALGALAGITSPPIEASVRAILSRTEAPASLQRLFAIDSAAQELLFISGPLIHVTVAGLFSPMAAVLTAAGVMAAGMSAMLLSPATALRPERRTPGARGAIRSPAVRCLALIGMLVGAFWGATSIALIARADELGATWMAGVFIAVWAGGSLIAGIAVVVRPWNLAPIPRMRVLLLAAAALALPLPLVSEWPVALAGVLFLQGLTIAPGVGAHAESIARAAPRGAATEAFAWVTSATVVGYAAGEMGGGVLIEVFGAPVSMAAAAAALVLGALVALGARPAPPRADDAPPSPAPAGAAAG